MDLKLRNRTAVVTGASKGIGLAIARALAEEGARVLAASRTDSAELKALMEDHDVEHVTCDLATRQGAIDLAAAAETAYGRVDILVNNVGASEPAASTLAFDDEQWQRIVEVTLFSAVRTVRATAPLMRRQQRHDGGDAAIVNIASLNATLPAGNIAPYAAAKAALVNVSKALSEELADDGIRVNAISPGPVRTPMWTGPGGFAHLFAEQAGITPTEVMDELLPESMSITLGRVAEPEEIADLALFLCSPRSRYITGANYVIDGGMLKTA
jgi:NAD(P)-dependent dehydrogenase (short-subunit alcohol dehydrogenase family)